MATSFPTSLQDLDPTRGGNNDPLSTPNHVDHHQLEDDTIEALQTKVGINNSADTNSIDYKLTNASSSNPGHRHTLANGATDVTATATELNYVDGVTSNIQTQLDSKQSRSTLTTKGDIYVATASATVTRLGKGTDGQFLKADSVAPEGLSWGDAVTSADVQTFNSSGTWTKPAGAKVVEVFLFGGGGGGGSGSRQNVSATQAIGGSGGAGGGYSYKKFAASALGSTETVTVGTGGAGGASRGTDGNGNAGTAGGASTFGTTVLVRAPGGNAGAGGILSTPGTAGGTGSQGNGDISQIGGDGGANGDPGSAGADTALLISPRGGGAGSRGDNQAGGGRAGGAFITNYVLAGGATATVGNSPTSGLIIGGTGGGGSSGAATSATGGAGGAPGGGGGGSGGATSASGIGGAGANGRVIVISYF